jgi:hypothetical protein
MVESACEHVGAAAAMAAPFSPPGGRARREEGMDGRGREGIWGTFYVLSSWPRCQVARGAWRTRGGDGLKRSVTRCSECLNGGRQW